MTFYTKSLPYALFHSKGGYWAEFLRTITVIIIKLVTRCDY